MIAYPACTVGIDLGDRASIACVYAQGTVVEWFEFPMTPTGVRAAFEGKAFGKVAMEAGAQSGWVTRLLRSLAYEPVVANPRKLKAISSNERKSDRNDALLLAKLAAADASLLHPIQHRSEERELALSVLHARDALVRARTRLIAAVRSMCKGVGARLKSGSADGFGGREADVPPELAPATTGMFVGIRALTEQIGIFDEQLGTMVETDFPDAQRVKQIRGVGPVSALAFVLALEEPARFPNGRTAAAWLGLVPRRDQSGAVDKQLGISKTGNTFVRRLLVQCAQYILGPFGHDCDLRRWGLALAARGGKGAKKRAICATARKLVVLMFRLWKSGDTWKPLHNAESHEVAPVTDAVRPQPAVSADCACFPENAGDGGPRRIDCSADDGPDPSMHRTPRGPTSSADRSMGLGTTSTGTTTSVPKAKKRTAPAVTVKAAKGLPVADQPGAPTPRRAAPKRERTAAFEGVADEDAPAGHRRRPGTKVRREENRAETA